MHPEQLAASLAHPFATRLGLLGAVNSKKQGRFISVTYPLHEAVKQNNAYITWTLVQDFGVRMFTAGSAGFTPWEAGVGRSNISGERKNRQKRAFTRKKQAISCLYRDITQDL